MTEQEFKGQFEDYINHVYSGGVPDIQRQELYRSFIAGARLMLMVVGVNIKDDLDSGKNPKNIVISSVDNLDNLATTLEALMLETLPEDVVDKYIQDRMNED